MLKQLIFTVILVVTIAAFGYTVNRLIKLFRLTKPAFPVRDWGKRVNLLLKVALGQSKIFRRPVVGFFHALVFWGFCIIIFGSIEMVIDGISGAERSLSFLGPVYDVLMAAGDIFALLVGISIIIFTIRRSLLHVKRFTGVEMKSTLRTIYASQWREGEVPGLIYYQVAGSGFLYNMVRILVGTMLEIGGTSRTPN